VRADAIVEKDFAMLQGVTFIVGIIAATSGLISFAYANFLTKDAYVKDQGSIEKRLDKIDDKIDKILDKMNGKQR